MLKILMKNLALICIHLLLFVNSPAIAGTQNPSKVEAGLEGDKRIFITTRFKSMIRIFDSSNYKSIELPKIQKALASIIVENETYLYFVNPLFLEIWDKKSLRKIGDVDYEGFFAPGMTDAVLTPDGNKMYIGVIGWGKSSTSGIYVIDLINKKQHKVLFKNMIETGHVDISENGKYIYVAGVNQINKISTETDEKVRGINIYPDHFIKDIASYKSDSVYMIIYSMSLKDPGGSDIRKDEIAFLDIKSRRMEIIDTGDINKIFRIKMGPDGFLYALGVNVLLKIDPDKKTLMKSMKLGFNGNSISFSDEGVIYISAPKERAIFIVERESGDTIKRIKIEDEPNEVYIF